MTFVLLPVASVIHAFPLQHIEKNDEKCEPERDDVDTLLARGAIQILLNKKEEAERSFKAAFQLDMERAALAWLAFRLEVFPEETLPPELERAFSEHLVSESEKGNKWIEQAKNRVAQEETYTNIQFAPIRKDAWGMLDFLELLSLVRKDIISGDPLEIGVSYEKLGLDISETFRLQFLFLEDETGKRDYFGVLAKEVMPGGRMHLSIRGTDMARAWIFSDSCTNLACVGKDFAETLHIPGKVHKGFGERAVRMLEEIQLGLESVYENGGNFSKVILSGHSQGGAVAQLLYPKIAKMIETHRAGLDLVGPWTMDLVTMGAPRVAADTEAKNALVSWGSLGKCYRLVLNNDPVTCLPLGTWSGGWIAALYRLLFGEKPEAGCWGANFAHVSESTNETLLQAAKYQYLLFRLRSRDWWQHFQRKPTEQPAGEPSLISDCPASGNWFQHSRKDYRRRFNELRPVEMENVVIEWLPVKEEIRQYLKGLLPSECEHT